MFPKCSRAPPGAFWEHFSIILNTFLTLRNICPKKHFRTIFGPFFEHPEKVSKTHFWSISGPLGSSYSLGEPYIVTVVLDPQTNPSSLPLPRPTSSHATLLVEAARRFQAIQLLAHLVSFQLRAVQLLGMPSSSHAKQCGVSVQEVPQISGFGGWAGGPAK